ncbi:exodeoxyribonuclease V subunit beta [Buchnera aphidicola (Periphyllus koelreuteriae)]|uniref:exodeoxyribonuclease V subunit beta n=1 Tax=Buchnera aphidicola TaxID=9 RepID=UPI0031B7FCE2
MQNRLSKNIYNLYKDCINKKTKNKNYKKIFKKIKNFKKAIKILKIAYLKINNAPIYTIHGFCKNILKKYNLNYKYSFDKKIYNEQKIYKKSTYDFWRKYTFILNKEILKIFFKYWKHPKNLLSEISPWLNLKSKIFIYNEKKENIFEKHKKNIKKIIKFKKQWKKNRIFFKKILLNLNLNKRIYNKKNLNRWIKKITLWSKKNTTTYNIPNELNYFKKKIKIKNFLFLKIIKKFLNINFSLKEIFLLNAIKKIKKISNLKKKKLFCFDNLIQFLLLNLKNNKNLALSIEKEFPIAFIDEFQDTDSQQYKIFKKIYKNKKKSSLILIGDPKQSIYNFRGADIFFYIKTKSKILNTYTLKKNWRSSEKLIKNINLLFKKNKNSFIFKEIKYKKLIPSTNSKKIKFLIKNKEQPSITFWLQPGKKNTPFEYNKWISKKCAKNIFYLINTIKNGDSTLKTFNKKKKLEIKDICILIKNYKEYKMIKIELKKLNINSYYTSNKKSIFKTIEVQEMFYILQSILNPSNEFYLKRALFTSIISKSSYLIFNLNKKYEIWSKIKKKFNNYYKIWKKNGILNLIKKIIYESNIYKKYFFKNKKKKKIENLIHLSEILEKKTILIKNFNSLILWFKYQIKKKINNKKYDEKNIYKKNSIQIVTIHKSKGLEYPILWIPFMSNFKLSKKYIFHDRKKFNTYINLEKNKNKIFLEEEERLSEDIRLLYVAITRAKFHCSIGVSPIVSNNKKKILKNNKTDFHKSGLGYILQKGKPMSSKNLKKELKKISFNKSIKITSKNKIVLNTKKKKKEKKTFIHKNFSRNFKKIFYTSYTKINKKKNIKHNNYIKNNKKKIKKYTSFSFPKGKKYGIFIHKILKKINFKKKINKNFLIKKIKKIKLSTKWIKFLKKWIKNILKTPLKKNGIKLYNINLNNCLKELEFSLFLKKNINLNIINTILKNKKIKNNYKKKCILNGCIDLVFKNKNKYYLIDYKSDYLGKNKKKYIKKNLKRIIKKNGYNIQYYLYSLALNKFLKHKLKKYTFKKNFGGIYYIFLRGINGKNNKYGILFHKPKEKKINKLNNFFL